MLTHWQQSFLLKGVMPASSRINFTSIPIPANNPLYLKEKAMTDNLTVLMPPAQPQALEDEKAFEAAADSFSVNAQGNGSVTGIAYTVPAYSDGRVTADIRYLSLTSADVDTLNSLIRGMVSASQYEKIQEYERIHASAKLSVWRFWSGGGSASYEKTRNEMRGFGLSEENIRTIISAMADIARNMSNVKLDINVRNSRNNFAVSGNLLVYTMAGTIKLGNEQLQYRMLSNQGTYGDRDRVAPADVNVIPLN
jgi:hypothetical protein